MSETVNIRSIEAIEAFRAALFQLRDEAREAVVAARLSAQANREWLAERHQHWQRRVTALAEELVEAEAALARCRSSHRTAGSDGCRAIADWTDQARHALWEAEGELRNVRHWATVVDECIASFERRAHVLTRELTDRVPLAATKLSGLTDRLDEYSGQ